MPWFPLWADDFAASPKVRVMSDAEVGVYLMLLIEQFQAGFVTWPCERKANALRTTPERIAYVLSECFVEEKRGWVNRKLQSITKEQTSKSGKARDAAKARWHKGPNANASPGHSERNAIHSQSHKQIQITASRNGGRGSQPELQLGQQPPTNGKKKKLGTKTSPEFDELWGLYKARGKRPEAWRLYQMAVPSLVSHAKIMEARESQVAACLPSDSVNGLDVFIRNEQWENEWAGGPAPSRLPEQRRL